LALDIENTCKSMNDYPNIQIYLFTFTGNERIKSIEVEVGHFILGGWFMSRKEMNHGAKAAKWFHDAL
jgi:hypothetical protein